MKKYKKLIALAVAVLTLSATAITASAAIKISEWNEATIEMGDIEAEYYLANNTIHYSELLCDYDKNFLIFSDVDKRLMEGNIVLSVDFSNPNGTTRREKYPNLYNKDFKEIVVDYMDGLYLKDANGKFITEGKYPLTVDLNGPKSYANVMVDTNWRVFSNFDMTEGHYVAWGSEMAYFDLYFQIKDMIVLPSYNIVLKEITSSSKPAEFTCNFLQNYCETYTKNGQEYDMTSGYVEFRIPTKYAGKNFYVYANGMNVGKVTLPKAYGKNASIVNY